MMSVKLKIIEKDIIDIQSVIDCVIEVNQFFKNKRKTTVWFKTKNPHLGNIKPLTMIQIGKAKKLSRLIKAMKEGNYP